MTLYEAQLCKAYYDGEILQVRNKGSNEEWRDFSRSELMSKGNKPMLYMIDEKEYRIKPKEFL